MKNESFNVDVSRFQQGLIVAENIADINSTSVLDTVQNKGFACIRGIFSEEQIRACLIQAQEVFDHRNDQPSMGESPTAVMDNYQKLAIGGAMQSWEYRPRFMRIFYNPLWADDIYGMRTVFQRLARLRNRIIGYRDDFAIDTVDEGLWTAGRLQQYPPGGGFFMKHRDVVISTVTEDAGIRNFIQILLLMTKKGVDYQVGGGFVESQGEVLNFEDKCDVGDVLLYDGRSVHGVAEVDPAARVDFEALSGRVVALASLYKDMSTDDKAYSGYVKRSAGAIQEI